MPPIENGEDAVSMADVKKLIQDQSKAFEAFKEANDKRLADMKKGQEDFLNSVKVDRINDAMTDMQKEIEAVNKKLNRRDLNGGGGDADAAEVTEYRAGFMNYLRSGNDAGLNDKARAVAGFLPKGAMSADDDGRGGYIVDPITVKRISAVIGTISAMPGLAEVVPAFIYEDAVEQHTTEVEETTERGPRTETEGPSFKEVKIEAGELYAHPKVTQKMLDLRQDAEAYVAQKVGDALAEKKARAYILGNGIKGARGLLTYTTVDNSSYEWGKVGYVKSGKSDNFADSDPADKLVDLVHALKKQYRAGASFLMNDLTEAAIRKLKDGDGRYIWSPGLMEGAPATLLGKPVATDDYMPDIAANSLSIAFGDFRAAYKIVNPGIMRVLRDPFTAKPWIVLYTTDYDGGGVANFEAVKLMKFAA